MVPVEDLGCAWSLRPHKLFLVAVADEGDLQAFTELWCGAPLGRTDLLSL